jgi:hypothetical protein
MSLRANNEATFFAEEFASYGLLAMGTSFSVDPAPWNHFKEIIFEWVRQKEFPNQVSRLSCVFGVSDLAELEAWSDLKSEKDCYIYGLSAKRWSKVDAGWLDDVQNNFSSWVRAARKYWKGDICTIKSRPEVLIALPAIVEEELHT